MAFSQNTMELNHKWDLEWCSLRTPLLSNHRGTVNAVLSGHHWSQVTMGCENGFLSEYDWSQITGE